MAHATLRHALCIALELGKLVLLVCNGDIVVLRRVGQLVVSQQTHGYSPSPAQCSMTLAVPWSVVTESRRSL